MTEEHELTGRHPWSGRCATCFKAFNPACPRAVLDESTQEVPRRPAEPVPPLTSMSQRRTTANPPTPESPAASGNPGDTARPRATAQPTAASRPLGHHRLLGPGRFRRGAPCAGTFLGPTP